MALGACATRPARDPGAGEAARAQIALAVDESARRVAVSKPGAKVCRQVRVGIAELDWLRGTVTEVNEAKIRIRLESVGRYSPVLNGAVVSPGDLLWDAIGSWVPCT